MRICNKIYLTELHQTTLFFLLYISLAVSDRTTLFLSLNISLEALDQNNMFLFLRMFPHLHIPVRVLDQNNCAILQPLFYNWLGFSDQGIVKVVLSAFTHPKWAPYKNAETIPTTSSMVTSQMAFFFRVISLWFYGLLLFVNCNWWRTSSFVTPFIIVDRTIFITFFRFDSCVLVMNQLWCFCLDCINGREEDWGVKSPVFQRSRLMWVLQSLKINTFKIVQQECIYMPLKSTKRLVTDDNWGYEFILYIFDPFWSSIIQWDWFVFKTYPCTILLLLTLFGYWLS